MSALPFGVISEGMSSHALQQAIEALTASVQANTAAIEVQTAELTANTLMLAGVREVLMQDGEAGQDEPAPVATYADGSPIG